MPRSIWKGAISFGLVTIPIKVYGAVEEKDLSFRQVHAKDGGRIRQKRVCEKCGEEVEFADLALAVVDEQHRFGVHQRMALSSKGQAVDLLVMSATPIPRNLMPAA